MKIAVLSGKGGTGKTFVSVNLSTVSENTVYLDCDVEEPDGHIFFKPGNIKSETVYKSLPSFDENKCTGCRKCIEFCAFNALAFVGRKPMIFQEVCHDCGGCELVCPEKAVTMKNIAIGEIVWGTHTSIGHTGTNNQVTVISGTLSIGEASGVPVIKAVLKKGNEVLDSREKSSTTENGTNKFNDKIQKDMNSGNNRHLIIDCPPGSSCAVMESIQNADYCILVTEPTPFGLHNMNMVYKLVTLMKKPCGVIINKADDRNMIDEFCTKNKVPVLAHIPFNKNTAKLNSSGRIISEQDSKYRLLFLSILNSVTEVIRKTQGASK